MRTYKKGVRGVDKVTERELMRGVRLTCVRAERFKTGYLSMTLLAPHTKKTASLNAVLPYVLRRGTARLPDMESIAARLDGLYGARIDPAIRKKGEVAAMGFCADFPDGAFLPGRPDILSPVAYLMGELLLSPATRGGRLRADFVESERRNLIDDINAEINDRRAYAGQRLVELMFRGESYGVSKLGTIADTGRVTVQILTRYYKELLSTAPMEVFYCGAEDPDRVERVVREALSALPRSGEHTLPSTVFGSTKPVGPVRTVREVMDVTQGRLCMGFRLEPPPEGLELPAMLVFNTLFGGCATSRLYLNVREKLALCYYVSSGIDRFKGALFVFAGIDFPSFDRVRDEITGELEAIARGEMEPWELESARRAVVSSIYSAMDEQAGLEELYLDRAILGLRPEPGELAALCADVTAEEVARVAQSAHLSHIYFLTAEGDDAEET